MKAIRLTAPAADLSKLSLVTLPKSKATETLALRVAGKLTSAVKVFEPTRPCSEIPEKVATPADAEIAAVPDSVAPVTDSRTV